MTQLDIIGMLKQAWTAALMDEKDLREDLAESYASWVRGLIQSAADELTMSGQQQAPQQPQGGQGGVPPMEGGGAPMPPAPAPEGGMQ